MVAKAMMSVADAIQREGLAFVLTGLPGQVEGLLAIDQGLFVPSELSLEPADIVQRDRLPGHVAGGAVQIKGPLGAGDGVGKQSLLGQRRAEGDVDIALTGEIAEPVEQGESLAPRGGAAEGSPPLTLALPRQ